MIPIAGSESEKSIARITSDVAHLAFRLNKPLGVRLLSIDTKAAGEQSSFAHDFVTNTAEFKEFKNSIIDYKEKYGS